MRKRIFGGSVLATSALIAGAVIAAPAADAAGTRAIPNTTPQWLRAATKLGAAPAGAPVSARIYLAPRGGLAALQAAAKAVATPGSAGYRKYISAAQYHAQYDPAASTVEAVKSWLTRAGLTVTATDSRYLDVAGNVASAQKAFGVSIASYKHDGDTVQAPSGALSAPVDVASSILAVTGVDTTPQLTLPATQKPSPPSAGFRNGKPCSSYYGEKTPGNTTTPDGTTLPQFQGATVPFAVCGYTGPQLRGAYEGANPALNGSGVTVAITDAYASPTILADANQYATQTGDPKFAAGQFSQNLPIAFTQVNTGKRQCDASGWYGEETLDVEAVHALAPAANIRYYAGASCQDPDLLATFSRINDENVADIVTNSWGDLGDAVKPATLAAYEAAFAQGALQGISYLFSAGDNGDETLDFSTPQTDYPASDPGATAVGGTATEIGQSGSIIGETGWQTTKYTVSNGAWTATAPFQYGGGGGYSTNIAEPDYQKAAGIQSPNGGRAVPDVALDADPTTGMLVGQTQSFPDGAYYDTYRIGGTSLASPLFAGITALKIQAHGRYGQLNPYIYTHGNLFTDVTGAGVDKGNIRVDYANGVDATAGYRYSVRSLDTPNTTLTIGPGWDSQTGFGSPRASWFLSN